jgi:hypothetical protein
VLLVSWSENDPLRVWAVVDSTVSPEVLSELESEKVKLELWTVNVSVPTVELAEALLSLAVVVPLEEKNVA